MRCTFFVDVGSAVLHWHDRIGTGLARHISDLLLGAKYVHHHPLYLRVTGDRLSVGLQLYMW